MPKLRGQAYWEKPMEERGKLNQTQKKASKPPSKTVKKRHWAYVLYPESVPDGWLDILRDLYLPCAISPLHDADFNADEAAKKAHYHVIICWPGPTTYGVALAVADSLNAPHPQPLESVRGYYRYFTHEDNPEKAQYDKADIQHFGGFDIQDFVELTSTEKRAFRASAFALIRAHGLTEYADLVEILLDSDDNDASGILDYVCTHTLLFDGYMRSRRHRAHMQS